MAVVGGQANFRQEVLESPEAVLVDFWAPWCGPCRAVGPVLEQIAAERTGELKLVKVNVDEEKSLARRYGVSTIPTIVLFRGGEPVAKAVGAQPKWLLELTLGLGSRGVLGRLGSLFR